MEPFAVHLLLPYPAAIERFVTTASRAAIAPLAGAARS